MARPALSDRKSERMQMVVAPEWIERVDDWAFERRIRSRSEAIRKLVDIALAATLSRHGEGLTAIAALQSQEGKSDA